jgi:hypothetical protein
MELCGNVGSMTVKDELHVRFSSFLLGVAVKHLFKLGKVEQHVGLDHSLLEHTPNCRLCAALEERGTEFVERSWYLLL